MWIFTVTAGRTGTAWLTQLISKNLGIESVHEHLEINDIGLRTPDIRVLRNFNTYGANEIVKTFWTNKLVTLPIKQDYFESNHTLAKAGLVEILALNTDFPPTKFILLRRNHLGPVEIHRELMIAEHT